MKKYCFLLLGLFCIHLSTFAQKTTAKTNDRKYWSDLCYKIAAPVLSNMSKGELKKNMMMEYSPAWDNRSKDVAYMEAFGRLMAGVAPWLALPEDNTPEGKQRKQLKEWALKSYANAVDPENPDYLGWRSAPQALVDAAYIANSFLRAPEALWAPLDNVTKERYIDEFKYLRTIHPPYNNWLLFRATIEAFFVSIGESYDGYVLVSAVRKMNEWYLGDGWYSDGTEFSLDYYNSFVMHPMFVEILEVLESKKISSVVSFDLALRRMQRYNVLLERMISPEATYPAMGRSITYRMGAFQTLALASWKYGLPEKLSNGQVRNALTAVMKRMFAMEGNFGKEGFLQLGFVGHQPNLADYYSNNGSMYLTSLVFLPLGLPANHDFWTSPAEEWTAQKAWSGKPFPKDYHESIMSYSGNSANNAEAKEKFIQKNIRFATAQTALMLKNAGEPTGKNYPRTMSNEGTLATTGMYDWTSGFFAGSLWYLYELTGDEVWKENAEKWTQSLEPLKTHTGTHDLGFMMYCSYGNAERLAPKPEYKGILTESANSLASRFSDKTGTIKSWNEHWAWDGELKSSYPVIIDNMMNLEMLLHEAKASDNKRLYDIAVTHANTTLKNHLRENFSTYHVVSYDTATGAVQYKATAQGFSDNSTWARGQAWAVYGYTMMYRETKDPAYLEAATKLTDYFLSQLPEDFVPQWDFNVGEVGYIPGKNSNAVKFQEKLKDVSAAAIVCSALFELSEYVKNKDYKNKAIKMLYGLSSDNYRAKLGENANFMLMHSVGSIPHTNEIDKPLVYADYYFLEALTRYKKTKF